MTTTSMQLMSRVFWTSKDRGFEQFYEDAYRVECARGVAAIADGVSSGFASGPWARLLTAKLADDAPDLEAEDGLSRWLKEVRADWEKHVAGLKLDFFQRQKLRDSGGAFSTLLWVNCHPGTTSQSESAPPAWVWSCRAAGDCGLFHERDGKILRVFPFENPDDLASDPQALASKNHGKDRNLEFKATEGILEPGDMLVLCTDALLGWALQKMQDGNPPAWRDYWDMPEETWREEIQALRAQDVIRVDDTTLILLRLELIPALSEAGPNADTKVDFLLPDADHEAEPAAAGGEGVTPLAEGCISSAADTAQPAVTTEVLCSDVDDKADDGIEISEKRAESPSQGNAQ